MFFWKEQEQQFISTLRWCLWSLYISSKALACQTSVILYSTLFISYHMLLTYQSGCIFCIYCCNFHCFRNFIKSRHTVVCQQPRNKKDVQHTVCYLLAHKCVIYMVPQSCQQPRKQKKTCSTQVSRHTVMCQWPRKQKKTCGTQVSRHTVVCQYQRKQKRHVAHKCAIYWYCKVAKFSLLYLQNY